eukprot:scaffold188794_cov33-Tisochrysis_lutea.AAC.3
MMSPLSDPQGGLRERTGTECTPDRAKNSRRENHSGARTRRAPYPRAAVRILYLTRHPRCSTRCAAGRRHLGRGVPARAVASAMASGRRALAAAPG